MDGCMKEKKQQRRRERETARDNSKYGTTAGTNGSKATPT